MAKRAHTKTGAPKHAGQSVAPQGSVWHVSAFADMLGYHWSWLPPLLLLLCLGDVFPKDYNFMLLAAWGLNFSHQALSLFIVYMDGAVVRAERRRLTALPLGLAILFLPTALWWPHKVPAQAFGLSELAVLPALALLLVLLDAALAAERRLPWRWLAALMGVCVLLPAVIWLVNGPAAKSLAPWLLVGMAFSGAALALAGARSNGAPLSLREKLLLAALCVAAAAPLLAPYAPRFPDQKTPFRAYLSPLYAVTYGWNFWHIYMQKYGILRLYAAKSGVPAERRTPGAVDRLLVFAWIPLLLVAVVPPHLAEVLNRYVDLKPVAEPLLEPVLAVRGPLLAIGVAVVVASALLFVAYEWRASRLRNWARLSAGGAFFALSGMFLLLNPIKVAIGFGVSHTVEYFVFVWAWQRKRTPGVGEPASATLLDRLMRRPARAVFGFALCGALFWYVVDAWGRDFGQAPRLLGVTPSKWLMAFAPYLAMSHFFFDGFLWKMRRPEVRARL